MTSGNINAGSYQVILSKNTSGALVWTLGTIIGKLQRAIGSTGSEYLYPVGTAANYNPAKITFNNLNPGSLALEYIAGDIGNTGLPVDDNGFNIYDRYTTGYWTITAVSGLTSTDYNINLNYTGFTGVYAGSRILRRDNGGNLTPDGSHGSVASPEITRTGLTGIGTLFTDFAICKSDPYISTQPSDASPICS
jgi:hypothetical protein